MSPQPLHQDYADGALQLKIDGPLATLTLNRPRQRNALNLAMWHSLPQVMTALESQARVRVLVIRGAGGQFASGADIAEFPEVFGLAASAVAYTRAIDAATAAIEQLGVPVIACIDGYCIGAGLAVALACDLRICGDTARFGAPPAKLGLLYSVSDTRRLMRAVGHARAKEMLLAATMITALQALDHGLVTEVHPADDLHAAVAAKAQALTELSGWSQRHAKAFMARIEAGQTEDDDATRDLFAAAGETDHFKAALAGFLGRRT
jgi:enoyl-CoA hydratase/carnithine racemase